MSTCLTMPRRPSCTTHQSCPGVRRRRDSQPSIHLPRSVYLSAMKIPRPGFSRFSFSAKNSSFAISAFPPTRSAARSTRPAGTVALESAGFTSAAAICAVGPRRDKQRNVVLRRRVRDHETDRDAIEEAAFAKIIADEKNQLVVSGGHFRYSEQRRIGATVRIRLHALQHFRLIERPKLDGHTGGRLAAHRIENVSRQTTH